MIIIHRTNGMVWLPLIEKVTAGPASCYRIAWLRYQAAIYNQEMAAYILHKLLK